MIAKVLCFAFWQLRCAVGFVLEDATADFRAQVLLLIIELALVLGLLGSALLICEHPSVPRSGTARVLIGCVIAGSLVGVNYYTVGYQNNWKRFVREFESYSRLTKTLGGIALVVALVLGFTAMVVSKAALNGLPRG